MNLKESYRYANFLDTLLNRANLILINREFITTTEQNHMRNKANQNAENETVILEKPYTYEATPMNVVDFTVCVLEEREKLHKAIALAKKATEIDIDVALSANKNVHEFIKTLSIMAESKPYTSQTKEYDYMINPTTGEQVKYYYPVESVVTIDFDRNQVKGLMKRLQKESDEKSTKLDMLEITTQVDFNPTWYVNDSFEELIEEFAKEKK